jgi:toxin CcdB
VVTSRQYDVHRVVGLRAESVVDLAIVLQDDSLDHLSTRVVAPLVQIDEEAAIDRSTPIVEMHGARYLIAVHLLATIPLRNLGTQVATMKSHERAIKNAIDTVFFGV